MTRASDSTLKVTIARAGCPEDVPAEGVPTRVVTVTIDDRARRSSPPPSVAVMPMVDVAASGSKRRLISRAATRTHGVTGPPAELLPETPAADVVTSEPALPEPSAAPAPQLLPRVRSRGEEPEWSSKPTVMDLPRVGDFIPDDELISTRAPTPRLMSRAPEPRRAVGGPSRVPSMLVALIALLALGVLLAATVALIR